MRRGACLAFACAFAAAAIFFARPIATPGPALRDFEAYWSAGATWMRGADPYGRDVWTAERTVPGVDASRDEVLPFVGPPASLPLWAALARLPYATAAVVWYAALALALLGVLLLVARAAAAPFAPLTLGALAVFAVGFGPVTSDLALGQIALLALFGATACVAASQTGPAALAAFVAYLQPNVALALLSQVGRNRKTLALVAGAVLSYLAGAFAAGWGWPVAYAQLLAAHASAERFTAIQISPGAIAYGFGAPKGMATGVGYAVALAAIAAAIVIARRSADAFPRFAAIGALVPFVAGFFHEHDLIVAFPAAILCALLLHGRARTLAVAGTLLVAVDWLGMAQRPTGIVQSALLAGTALAAFAALGRDDDLAPTLAGGVAVVPLFAFAAWLAAAQPLSVWPDALGAFHAGAAAPIATVWYGEQRAAGLFWQQPAWGFLRLLSLLGCAILALTSIYTTVPGRPPRNEPAT